MPSARRALRIVLAVVLLATAASAPASADDGHPVAYTYEVEIRGATTSDPTAFARQVDAILSDARGWSLGGSVRFSEVASGGDLRLVLASPAEVAAADPGCSVEYSCRVGDEVLVNERNWREATPHWRSHGAPLWEYRRYVVNHEVGHWLGYGHTTCPSAGRTAPVMLQQSIDTEGCEPNAWPVEAERADLGARLEVPVHDDWVLIHVRPADGLRERPNGDGVGDGSDVPDHAVTSTRLASRLMRALRLAR